MKPLPNLIARLRSAAYAHDPDYSNLRLLCLEAADEIERLRHLTVVIAMAGVAVLLIFARFYAP